MAFKDNIERLQPVSVLGSLIIRLNSIKRIRMCELSGHESSAQGQVVLSPGGWQKYVSYSRFFRSTGGASTTHTLWWGCEGHVRVKSRVGSLG